MGGTSDAQCLPRPLLKQEGNVREVRTEEVLLGLKALASPKREPRLAALWRLLRQPDPARLIRCLPSLLGDSRACPRHSTWLRPLSEPINILNRFLVFGVPRTRFE